jgi:hypothetical protein
MMALPLWLRDRVMAGGATPLIQMHFAKKPAFGRRG